MSTEQEQKRTCGERLNEDRMGTEEDQWRESE